MGMRDRAMQAKEAEETGIMPTGAGSAGFKGHQQSLMGDDWDWGGDHHTYGGKTTGYDGYKKPEKGTIVISMTLEADEIGPEADDTNEKYNYNTALRKAEETAYDRIEALLGKNYESKYTLRFEVDDWKDYDVIVTLTPIK